MKARDQINHLHQQINNIITKINLHPSGKIIDAIILSTHWNSMLAMYEHELNEIEQTSRLDFYTQVALKNAQSLLTTAQENIKKIGLFSPESKRIAEQRKSIEQIERDIANIEKQMNLNVLEDDTAATLQTYEVLLKEFPAFLGADLLHRVKHLLKQINQIMLPADFISLKPAEYSREQKLNHSLSLKKLIAENDLEPGSVPVRREGEPDHGEPEGREGVWGPKITLASK